MPTDWHQVKDGGRTLVLSLYIQPNASRTEISGMHGDALKIKIAAPPTDNQANDKLLEFLRKSFRVNKKQVVLTHGEHSRHKTVEILDAGCSPEMLVDKA